MRFVWALGIVTSFLWSGAATAQSPRAGDPAPWASGLASQDRAELARAIAAVQRDRSFRAVRALADRIADGLPPPLLDAAIDALTAVGPRGSRVLLGLTRHRRPAVRAKVAAALVATRAPNARRELVRLLDDSSTTVRTAAARALGEMGARMAMRELVRAAQAGVPEAAAIVGAQATSNQVRDIVRRFDAEALDAYAPMMEAFTARSDLDERTRRFVVTKLAEGGTPGCFAVLGRIAAGLPEGDPIRAVAEELAEAQGEDEDDADAPGTAETSTENAS